MADLLPGLLALLVLAGGVGVVLFLKFSATPQKLILKADKARQDGNLQSAAGLYLRIVGKVKESETDNELRIILGHARIGLGTIESGKNNHAAVVDHFKRAKKFLALPPSVSLGNNLHWRPIPLQFDAARSGAHGNCL